MKHLLNLIFILLLAVYLEAPVVGCESSQDNTAGTCFMVDGEVYRINSVFEIKMMPVALFLLKEDQEGHTVYRINSVEIRHKED